jgi:ATP-binding cassette, subfamily B, bacterial
LFGFRTRSLDSGTISANEPEESQGAGPITDALRPTTSAGWALLFERVKIQRRGIALGVFVGMLWTIGKVAVPWIVQQGVDQGIEATPPDTSRIRFWALMVLVAGAGSAVFAGARRYMAFREARRTEADLRDQIFAQIQRLHFAYHDRTQAGQLMSRGNTDLQQVQQFVVMIPVTISNALTVLTVTVLLVLIDPVLTLFALGSLPLVNVLGKKFSTNLFPNVMRIQEESAQLASVVDESVQGIRVVKGFGAEAAQSARLKKEADDVFDAAMDASKVRSTYLPAIELMPNVGLIAVLAYGGHQVLNGNLTIGTLLSFNLYVVLLIQPLRMLGMIIAQAQRAAAAGERVAEVLSTAPNIVEPHHPTPLPAKGPGLGEVRFDDVTFAYGDGTRVLNGLDLTIPAGESVALVGATGSGKSTIARLIPRFYDVESGRLTIDGVDVREAPLAELRRSVGIVFEDTFLFSASIAANIAFADPDAPEEQIHRAARLAGAHDFIADLPQGYLTEIGERGFSLSGGQRQRIAIARAILADPRVLILDDATSSVDPTKEHEIRDALGEVMRGRTTIVIAHRPATIALADRVVLLGQGRIIAEGTHEELLRTSGAYRTVLAAIEQAGELPEEVHL